MKAIQIIAIGCLGLSGYQYYQELKKPPRIPYAFEGTWQANEYESMRELYRVGVTKLQKEQLVQDLGKTTYQISQDTWRADIEGQLKKFYYSVTFSDKNCYQVSLQNSGQKEVCVEGDQLYVSTGFKGAREVFDRIDNNI